MQPLDSYLETGIGASDNVRIVSLLFDGAVNFIRIARRNMEKGDVAARGLYIGKATSVVAELSAALDMEQGGEIAGNLKRLYDFVTDRLLRANIRADAAALDEAERVLEVLRSGWKEMEKRLAPAAPRSCPARPGGTLVSA